MCGCFSTDTSQDRGYLIRAGIDSDIRRQTTHIYQVCLYTCFLRGAHPES